MQTDSLWKAVLGEIELSVSKGSFLTWFKNTDLLRYDQELTIVGVQNVFIQQQLEKKFKDLIDETLAKKGYPSKKIEFKIITSKSTKMIYDEPVILEDIAEFANEEEKIEVEKVNLNGLSHSYRQGLNEKIFLR